MPMASAASAAISKSSAGGREGIVRQYLIAYNLISCLAWSYVWCLIIHHLTTRKDPINTLYERIERPLQITQSFAALEILHILLGWVRSPLISSILQVGSRLYIVWGILFLIPESRHHLGFLLTALVENIITTRHTFACHNL